MFPPLRGRPERCLMLWPVVQCRRVEIGTGRPNQRMNFRVKLYLGEKRGISQWTKKLTFQDRLKIDAAA